MLVVEKKPYKITTEYRLGLWATKGEITWEKAHLKKKENKKQELG